MENPLIRPEGKNPPLAKIRRLRFELGGLYSQSSICTSLVEIYGKAFTRMQPSILGETALFVAQSKDAAPAQITPFDCLLENREIDQDQAFLRVPMR